MFSVGGLSAELATVETGLRRGPHLPDMVRKSVCFALQQLLGLASKAPVTLRALDVNPTVLLVVNNTTQSPGSLVAVKHDYAAASPIRMQDISISSISGHDINVPANSTRNVLLSTEQAKSILGLGDRQLSTATAQTQAQAHGTSSSFSPRLALAWRMPSVQRCGLLREVPLAAPACASPPPVSMQIQLTKQNKDAEPTTTTTTTMQCCRCVGGSCSLAEVSLDYTDGSDHSEAGGSGPSSRSSAACRYEMALVVVNSPISLDGAAAGASSASADMENGSRCPCPVVVSGFPRKSFASSQLPLKHTVKLWFTFPGLAKVFAAIRREGSDEWYVSTPLNIQVSDAAYNRIE